VIKTLMGGAIFIVSIVSALSAQFPHVPQSLFEIDEE
jgi:hypothetical protein